MHQLNQNRTCDFGFFENKRFLPKVHNTSYNRGLDMDSCVIKKYFSKNDDLFHIIIRGEKIYDKEEKTYSSFHEFYTALDRDLSDANLLDYDFDGIDLNKYDLSKAKLSSAIMIRLGIYRDDLFKVVTQNKELTYITPSKLLEQFPSRKLEIGARRDNNFVLCYISDLHLNCKLVEKFKNSINHYELEEYFREVIIKLKNTLPSFTYNCSIVFIGDISYNFEIFKNFFKIFREEIPYQETFVVLGNHELWDDDLNKSCVTIEEIVEEYRTFLNSLNCRIHLLENQLFLPNDEQKIYSQDEILGLDNKVLRQKFLCNSYAIFGGIGYAGINKELNANHGIYKTKYITREQEKERSNKVDMLHRKLTEVACDKTIFFITHMPKDAWSSCDYNKNWFYISGHTHQNTYIENEDMKIYADNQIGYEKNCFSFKYLMTTRYFNIFQDYADGICEITREQYILFYNRIGNRIDFNREFEKLFMVKRNGFYCFLLK